MVGTCEEDAENESSEEFSYYNKYGEVTGGSCENRRQIWKFLKYRWSKSLGQKGVREFWVRILKCSLTRLLSLYLITCNLLLLGPLRFIIFFIPLSSHSDRRPCLIGMDIIIDVMTKMAKTMIDTRHNCFTNSSYCAVALVITHFYSPIYLTVFIILIFPQLSSYLLSG